METQLGEGEKVKGGPPATANAAAAYATLLAAAKPFEIAAAAQGGAVDLAVALLMVHPWGLHLFL